MRSGTHACAGCLWLAAGLAAAGAGEGRLLFRSAFEKGVEIGSAVGGGVTLTGKDSPAASDWERDLPAKEARFTYLTGKEAPERYVHTELVNTAGRDGATTRALLMSVKGDYPGDSAITRNELSLFAPIENDQAYARYWLKFPAGLAEAFPAKSWRMLMEWKEPDSGAPRNPKGGTNNWRMNVIVRRDPATGRLFWYVQGQTVQPLRVNDWTIENRDVPVPEGEWFHLEVFWRKHPVEGRLWFAVNGREICDYRGRTEHGTNPLPLKFWSIFKLYHGVDWLKSGPTRQWVDDVEIWSDFPPGHPKPADSRRGAPGGAAVSYVPAETLYEENFDGAEGKLPPEWWVEGTAAHGVRDGRLYANGVPGQAGVDSPQATAWLDRRFSGDLQLDFDVHVYDSRQLRNNINLFFLLSEPSGKPPRESAAARAKAEYKSYHAMSGYLFTYLADGTETPARFRLRHLPGFDNLVYENYTHHARTGRTYHITVRKAGGRVLYIVDGIPLCDAAGDRFHPAPEGGWIGFRTWHTALWWDNVRVTRLRPMAVQGILAPAR